MPDPVLSPPAIKRRRATDDAEVFTAYRTLAAETQSVLVAHVEGLVALIAEVMRAGVAEGAFHKVDPVTTARAVLMATSRFHHPAHATEWADPAINAVRGCSGSGILKFEIWNLKFEI